MSQASFSDDAVSVVEAIQDGVKTETIMVESETFTTRPVYLVPEKPDVRPLRINSLDGLIEYLNENVDDHKEDNMVIVVNSPKSVDVFYQVIFAKDSRTKWLEATYSIDEFPFGKYLSHEEFMVAAQCLLCESHDRETLLKYIGNLTTAQISNSVDNGISQTVIVETGVRKSAVELPNPVTLAPHRTFAEITQPTSPFVLRVRQSREGQMPEIALYEADGGLWKLNAIDSIKKYIANKIEHKFPVIG